MRHNIGDLILAWDNESLGQIIEVRDEWRDDDMINYRVYWFKKHYICLYESKDIENGKNNLQIYLDENHEKRTANPQSRSSV